MVVVGERWHHGCRLERVLYANVLKGVWVGGQMVVAPRTGGLNHLSSKCFFFTNLKLKLVGPESVADSHTATWVAGLRPLHSQQNSLPQTRRRLQTQSPLCRRSRQDTLVMWRKQVSKRPTGRRRLQSGVAMTKEADRRLRAGAARCPLSKMQLEPTGRLHLTPAPKKSLSF